MSDADDTIEGLEADRLDAEELRSRLAAIEDQPLESRASDFARIHHELQSRLENGDAPRSHG